MVHSTNFFANLWLCPVTKEDLVVKCTLLLSLHDAINNSCTEAMLSICDCTYTVGEKLTKRGKN